MRACLVAIASALAVAPAAVAAERTPYPARSAPALIERAAERGAIDSDTATLYRAYAVKHDPRLPRAYRGSAPWDGTLVLRRLRRALPRMAPGPKRETVEDIVTPAAVGSDNCGSSLTPTTDTKESAHFYIEYNSAAIGGGLNVDHYIDSLEEAWTKEVDDFDWAAPPVKTSNPAPNNKYHVRIDVLGPTLYGFVSDSGTHAGTVPGGNNPNTPWNEGDARASCMVLNQDYSTFPSGAPASLDSTTAHEFNHSLQYGYGALNGVVPDDSFIEGGATWMEDEVQDGADDNYLYLWPDFTFDMGEYGDDPYAYWITFRGLTERFGAGTAGGAEQVMQDFWERTSQNVGMLTALQAGLTNKGTTIADAYHAYAVAVKFNRPCGVASYAYPYCFEEGPAYVTEAGVTPTQGNITTVPGTRSAGVEDNYALNWIQLPASGAYSVTLTNNSSGGQLRGSVACDTGSLVRITPLPAVAGGGMGVKLGSFDTAGCAGAPIAVLTNQTQTAVNPSTFAERAYTLATGAIGANSVTGGPAPQPAGSGAGSGSGSGSGSQSGATKDTRAPTVRLKVGSRRALLRLLRRGLLVRVRSSEAASVRAGLLIGSARFSRLARGARRVTVARGSTRLSRAGSKRVRLRFTRRARRVLRRARTLRLVLSVRATDAAKNRRLISRRIAVRR